MKGTGAYKKPHACYLILAQEASVPFDVSDKKNVYTIVSVGATTNNDNNHTHTF